MVVVMYKKNVSQYKDVWDLEHKDFLSWETTWVTFSLVEVFQGV